MCLLTGIWFKLCCVCAGVCNWVHPLNLHFLFAITSLDESQYLGYAKLPPQKICSFAVHN